MDIKFDKNNVRIHDIKSLNAVKNSIKKLGAGRSIVIDKNDNVIGGEATLKSAQELGVNVKIVDSDGSELIAVRRTDLDYGDAKRKALAIADNRCSDLSFFDNSKLAGAIFDCQDFITDIGFEDIEIEHLNAFDNVLGDLVENNFANSVKGASSLFTISFNFNKFTQNVVAEYVNSRKDSKFVIANMIVEFCKKELDNA